MKFDLHIHTTRHSPDSDLDPSVLVRRARAIGLDGVVITEHDRLWSDAELDELRREAEGLVVLSGMEVSAREGHFLVYNIHNPAPLRRGIRVADLCREVHQQGGVVVAAHPFRWGQPFDQIVRTEQPEIDGLELMSNNMDADCRRRAAQIREELGLAGLGNSDAHDEDVVGICYTEFPKGICDSPSLAHAIVQHQVTAHERPSSDLPV